MNAITAITKQEQKLVETLQNATPSILKRDVQVTGAIGKVGFADSHIEETAIQQFGNAVTAFNNAETAEKFLNAAIALYCIAGKVKRGATQSLIAELKIADCADAVSKFYKAKRWPDANLLQVEAIYLYYCKNVRGNDKDEEHGSFIYTDKKKNAFIVPIDSLHILEKICQTIRKRETAKASAIAMDLQAAKLAVNKAIAQKDGAAFIQQYDIALSRFSGDVLKTKTGRELLEALKQEKERRADIALAGTSKHDAMESVEVEPVSVYQRYFQANDGLVSFDILKAIMQVKAEQEQERAAAVKAEQEQKRKESLETNPLKKQNMEMQERIAEMERQIAGIADVLKNVSSQAKKPQLIAALQCIRSLIENK